MKNIERWWNIRKNLMFPNMSKKCLTYSFLRKKIHWFRIWYSKKYIIYFLIVLDQNTFITFWPLPLLWHYSLILKSPIYFFIMFIVVLCFFVFFPSHLSPSGGCCFGPHTLLARDTRHRRAQIMSIWILTHATRNGKYTMGCFGDDFGDVLEMVLGCFGDVLRCVWDGFIYMFS